jgi:hypothetical protein
LLKHLDIKLIVKENKKINGRYEVITQPGKYLLEITKQGFEVIYLNLLFKIDD